MQRSLRRYLYVLSKCDKVEFTLIKTDRHGYQCTISTAIQGKHESIIAMKTLYPEINAWQTFFLETDSKHSIYVEQCGNPEGIPVVFLHGGPCSGCMPDHRRFFDPDIFHIILFDQRGCGLSLPFGELEDNTTGDIIDDMERIRRHLGIKHWLLFGGSWGGTLALLYAQQHIQNVLGLVIRGVFLARQKDLDWFIREGAGRIYPEQWQQLLNSVQEQNGKNLLRRLCDSLWSDDEVARKRVAREWLRWGSQVSLGQEYEPPNQDQHVTIKMVQQVRMELHYAKNRYFIAENQILEHCAELHGFPVIIIHGRNDLVCPMEAGYRLHQALPGAEFVVLSNAGHVARGRQMIDALVTATDRMAKQIKANPHAQ